MYIGSVDDKQNEAKKAYNWYKSGMISLWEYRNILKELGSV